MRVFVSVWLGLLTLGTWLGGATVARADVVARTSVVPSAGSAVGVGDRTVLGVRVEGRQVVGPIADDSTTPAFLVAPGVHFGLAPILGVSLGYAYARGVFPLEGPATQEHDITPALSLGTDDRSLGRFGIHSRTKAELRIMDLPDRGWHTELRPREEVTVTVRLRPWLQTSLITEMLLQPSHPIEELLQLRVGPALHGAIKLRQDASDRGPRLLWFAGAAAGLWPIDLALAGRRDESDQPPTSPDPQVVDVVVRFGLSAVF